MNRFRILKMLQDLSLGKTCMGLLSCFMIILCACSTDGDIQKILGTKAEAPVFLECRPVSSTEVLFKFSKPVNLVSVNFDPGMDVLGFENGSELRIKLSIAPESGQKITADILVEDSDRNSLNVIVPFRARNDR
ncbi:MAG: hypothetical protein FWH35_05810, partial [Treponema sp.]|nr:hypothetical protein [Treponema sp.]